MRLYHTVERVKITVTKNEVRAMARAKGLSAHYSGKCGTFLYTESRIKGRIGTSVDITTEEVMFGKNRKRS